MNNIVWNCINKQKSWCFVLAFNRIQEPTQQRIENSLTMSNTKRYKLYYCFNWKWNKTKSGNFINNADLTTWLWTLYRTLKTLTSPANNMARLWLGRKQWTHLDGKHRGHQDIIYSNFLGSTNNAWPRWTLPSFNSLVSSADKKLFNSETFLRLLFTALVYILLPQNKKKIKKKNYKYNFWFYF